MTNEKSLRKTFFRKWPSKKAPTRKRRLFLGEMLERRTLLASNFTFVLITDAHVGDNHPQDLTYLHQAVDQINLLNPLPEAVLFDGDSTDSATNAEFDALMTEMNRLNPAIIKAPVPGNHDAQTQTLAAGYQVKVQNAADPNFK